LDKFKKGCKVLAPRRNGTCNFVCRFGYLDEYDCKLDTWMVLRICLIVERVKEIMVGACGK